MSISQSARTNAAAHAPEQPLDVENVMAEIEKGQQLAGHFPDDEALGRARRVLTGETSIDDAREELRAKYAQA